MLKEFVVLLQFLLVKIAFRPPRSLSPVAGSMVVSWVRPNTAQPVVDLVVGVYLSTDEYWACTSPGDTPNSLARCSQYYGHKILTAHPLRDVTAGTGTLRRKSWGVWCAAVRRHQLKRHWPPFLDIPQCLSPCSSLVSRIFPTASIFPPAGAFTFFCLRLFLLRSLFLSRPLLFSDSPYLQPSGFPI